MNSENERFIRRTFQLAKFAVNCGNHPFGALLARNGHIVLEAENTVNDQGDCTGHAELNLVRNASKELGEKQLSECTLYTSTEPCPMCAGAIFWAGVRKIVYSVPASELMNITNYGIPVSNQELFKNASHEIEVEGPILMEEGLELHRTFWKD